jgi:serine/threonine protein kinase
MTAASAPEQFGPYLVYERLGAGGMATVHRAVKTGFEGFQRPVALKRLLSQYAGDQDFVRGFVREARLASRLQHANIAQTYDLGRVDHTYYIAMELVDGYDLRHVLRHIAYSVGPMPVSLVLAVMLQVCDALDYAHNFADETGRPLGIVHRDVSPSNLLVGRDGVVKIIDFGIAKASSATLYTASGVLKGKFSYMAPESLDGHTDSRSDLFAVGAVIYELLTARPLFKGKTDFDTLDQIKRMQPPPPSKLNPQIPPEVDQVVLTALAKNPVQRWQAAGQLRNALGALADRQGMRASHLDVPRWIEWALAQPAQKQAWDEAPATSTNDDSIIIEVEQSATTIGHAPIPAAFAKPQVPGVTPVVPQGTPVAPGVDPSRVRTLLVEGSTPLGAVGGGIPGLIPLHAQAAQPAPTEASGKPTMVPWAQPAHAPAGVDPAQLETQLLEPQRPFAIGTPQVPAQAQRGDNPLANPEYLAAAAAFNAAEAQRRQMEHVVSLPDPGVAVPGAANPGSGGLWILLVLLLCAGAAVGGFFLVDALM